MGGLERFRRKRCLHRRQSGCRVRVSGEGIG